MSSVYRWTRQHAFIVGIAFFLSIIQGSALILSLAGLLSFIALIYQHPKIETEAGLVPVWSLPANWVTMLRVVTVTAVGLSFTLLPPLLLPLLGIAILLSDYIDGALAKRGKTTSIFGAQFDQESDAFFIGVYSLILYLGGYVGLWVVTLGLLRYVNIIGLVLLKQQHKKEPRFAGARVVAVVVMIALLIPFITPSAVYTPYLIISVVALIFSFGYTFSAQLLQPE